MVRAASLHPFGRRPTGPALLETPAAGSICHAADMYRRAAGYIARILRGTKASDLPIKFEFAVNLKTAKTLDLVIPATLLTRADEVIRGQAKQPAPRSRWRIHPDDALVLAEG